MRRLISAVRTVVAYPSRWATTLTDWNRRQADQRILRADIDAIADPLRQWVLGVYENTRKEAA